MILVLDNTTRTIKAKLGEAKDTNEVQFTAHWADITSNGTAMLEGPSFSNSSGTSDVTIVGAPGSDTRRDVKYITIFNADVIPHVVIFWMDDNGTPYYIASKSLGIGKSCTLDNLIEISVTSGSGTTDHAELTNLEYASSGHTGFQPAGNYLVSGEELDPLFTAWNKSDGISITESQISDLQSYLVDISAQDLSTADNTTSAFITLADIPVIPSGGITEELDPVFSSWLGTTPPAYPGDIPTDTSDLTNGAGYITSGEVPAETDPVFSIWDKSTGISITESQISDLQAYLTSISGEDLSTADNTTSQFITLDDVPPIPSGVITEELDPVFSGWNKSDGISITENQISDLQNYLLTISGEDLSIADNSNSQFITLGDLPEETDPVFSNWDKSTGISISEDQISDLQNYLITISGEDLSLADNSNSQFITLDDLPSESDPVFTNAIDVSGADSNDVLIYNGSKFVPTPLPSGGGVVVEVDPVFETWLSTTPPAYPDDIPTALSDLSDDSTHRVVTDVEKGIWNDKQPAGNYLVSGGETDPIFIAWNKSDGISITESQISDLQTYLTDIANQDLSTADNTTSAFITLDDLPVIPSGGITEELDPVFSGWNKSDGISITENQISDLQNYLLSISGEDLSIADNSNSQFITLGDVPEETDPVFSNWDKSTGINISEDQISDLQNYLLTISGGDHSTLSNLSYAASGHTGFQPAGSYLTDAPSNGETYGRKDANWVMVSGGGSGTTDHAELTNLDYESSGHTGFQPAGDYLVSGEEQDPLFTAWNKSDGISITENQISDLQNYLTTISGEDLNLADNSNSQFITISDVPAIPDSLSDLSDDSTHRLVTDTEKGVWNGKQDAGAYLVTISGGNHATLANLSYASAGHTGFQPAGSYITDAPSDGSTYGRKDANWITVSGGGAGVSNGTAQYQVLTTGATPFVPAWSGFLLGGTTGGKTTLAVTNAKTLTLTATDDFNLTIPATGTAALLATANTFTATQTISNTAPSLIFTDTTASAKGLTIAVDANLANLREAAGASGSLMVLDLANNRVGIGTAAPTVPLTISGNAATLPAPTAGVLVHVGAVDGGTSGWFSDSFAGTSTITFRRANTTAASPSNLVADNLIGNFAWTGFGATAYLNNSAAKIGISAAETWTDSTGAAYMSFYTRPTGTTAAATEQMRIASTGKVLLATSLYIGDFTGTTNATITKFSADGTMAGNSDTALPTEKAVKTYADTKQATDATLTSIAALGTAADKMAYTTGVDTWAEASITAAGRAILDDANAAAQLATLGAAPSTQITGGGVLATGGFTLTVPATGTALLSTEWAPDTNTWTRTGNHTFTVAANVTAIFTKGTRVRWKDGAAFKYGYVLSATYGAPNTTVTLITNTSYLMSAAAITDNYYSYSKPADFPNYLLYAAALDAVHFGSPPAIGNGTIAAGFSYNGGVIQYYIDLTFGASSTYGVDCAWWTLSLPINNAGTISGYGECGDSSAGLWNYGMLLHGGSGGPTALCITTSTGGVFITQGAPFTFATSDLIHILGSYIAA